MLFLARWLARNAFGIGIAIGLVLNLGLLPLLEPAKASISCPDTTGQSQEVTDWVTLQCTVQQAMFNDGSLPGMAFAMGTTDPCKPNKYAIKDWRGMECTLSIANVIPLNLKDADPDLAEAGVQARLIWGQLLGPAGGVSISGVALYLSRYSTDNQYVFLVNSIIPASDLASEEEVSRIQAGVRILDVETFRSTPLSDFESGRNMSASSDDLSTVFASGVSSTGAGGGSGGCGGSGPLTCVESAYCQYYSNLQAVNEIAAECLIGATLAMFAALLACSAVAIITILVPITATIAGICTGAALLTYLFAAGVCTSQAMSGQSQAKRNLIFSLRACGVSIVEF